LSTFFQAAAESSANFWQNFCSGSKPESMLLSDQTL
jgi:hypothetical protein